MKTILHSIALFVFSNASSQVTDSTEIERMRSSALQFNIDATAKVLPDFTAKDTSGKIYTNNSISNGKVTFVDLWFASCEPCIAEIPNLNRLFDLIKDRPDFQFFAITFESEARAKEAIVKYNMHFPVLLASAREANKLTFGNGYPTNMVLDKEGKLRAISWSGPLDTGAGFELYWKQEMEKLSQASSRVNESKSVDDLNIVIIDSSSKIQSLDALTNYFNKKSLFIDLWASWCSPCREDFNFRNSVDSFLRRHEIVRVFISIDNPNAEQIWKRLIYEYELSGYHLLAGTELFKNLKEVIYKNGQIEVPKYIIVKDGKVVEANAFRPGDDEKLLKQLREKLL